MTGSGNTSVFFGGVASPLVNVLNSTTLTATCPGQTASGQVHVTASTGAGTSAQTAADLFTYSPVGLSVTAVSPNSGPTAGGTFVTISGTGFTNPATVTFGGVAATNVTVVLPTQITATAPAQSAGVVDVQVTTAAGSSNVGVAGDRYTYTDGPTVTSVSPNTGPSSGVPATFVTITGTNFIVGGSGMTVKFGSTATTNFTVTSTTTINVIAPAHSAGTVDVVVTTPGGSSPISAADQFTFEGATVPVVTSVSPSSGPTGTVVVITGSGFTGVSCPGGITFGGVAAANDGSCVVNNDSTITAKVPANAPGGTIDVRVTGPGGQSANTGSDNFNNTSSQSTYTYTLNFRFTLIGWAGPDNTPVMAALQGTANTQVEAAATPNSIYNVVTAIWTYDTSSQSYKGYFPGSENVPGANDFTVFHTGVGYFVAISVSTIQWTVVTN